MKTRAWNLLLNLYLGIVMVCIAFTFIYAPDSSAQDAGNIFGQSQVLRAGSAEFGVVLQVSIKQEEANPQSRITAAGVGAAIGGLLASRTGGASWGKNALGAMLGGVIGERVANSATRTDAQEIVVQTIGNDGKPRLMVIVQSAPFDPVSAGQNVLITNINGKVRVIPNNIAMAQR